MRIKWFHSQRNSLANSENSIKSKNTATNEMVYDQSTEQVEIISFQDEGRQEDLNAPIQQTNIPNSLVQASTHEQKNHTIPGFLQRAYQIDNFQWTTTDAAGTVLKQYRFPDVLLKQPALARKAFNFFGLRAGVEFIVLVNKQQFQQGNLLISFLPGAKYNPAKDAMCQATSPASNVNLTTLTGMPRTNLDLMDATRSDLTVPYASPYIYYNLLTGDGTIGDFYITVYSKLGDVAADGTVSVQVMARFVDVDLQFPAGTDMASFSVAPKIDHLFSTYTRKPDVTTLKALVEEGKQILEQVRTGSFRFQMNSEKLATANFKPKALPNMAVADESNNAHLLALSSNNSLPPANMGKASQSEMNFRKIVQIPVYFDRFDISSSDAGGKNVWSRTVELLDYANKSGDQYGVDYITFIGQNFSKWRSSFIYHFRFVKTTFHSLRVRIFFAPNASSVEGVDRNAVISKIVDLKDNNFVEFEVPFVWPHPFLSTDTSFSHSLGIVGVDVLTKMVNPTTVKNEIEVIVERSAGTDFCVNLPKELTYFPYYPPEVERKGVVTPVQPEQQKLYQRPAITDPVSNIVPKLDLNPTTSEFVPEISSSFVNSLKNIPESTRKYILQNAGYFTGQKQNLTDINELSGYRAFETAMLRWPPQQVQETLRQNVRAYEMRKKKKKRSDGTDEVDGWQRDLTEEGVEPNPGPVYTSRFLSSEDGGGSSSINTGMPIGSVVTGCSIRVTSPVSCTGTVNLGDIQLRATTSADSASKTAYSSLYVGAPSTASSGTIDISAAGLVECNIAWRPNSSQPVAITNVPLPISSADSDLEIVATRSDAPSAAFRFQMNHEQDDYRPGYDDTSYVRPVKSVQADDLILGAPVSSINEMINRSSLVTSFAPTTQNDIYVMPHFIGVCQKDANNDNIYGAADMLSYYASLFAFARGGVNLKIATSPDFFYNAILDPDAKTLSSADSSVSAQRASATPVTTQLQQQVSIQQVIKPSLEGFGEITVPFYSDTYMYYVNPVTTQNPSKTMQTMQLPFTTTIIRPYGQLSRVQIYRAACKDFELSYLTGPPRMVSMV